MPQPAIAPVWLKELDPGKGQLELDRAIAKLRDEVTGVLMDRHRGNERSLSFVLAKLDEARQWAITYLESQGAVVVLPKAEIMREAFPVTTHTTLEKGIPENV